MLFLVKLIARTHQQLVALARRIKVLVARLLIAKLCALYGTQERVRWPFEAASLVCIPSHYSARQN
jgi:hypothetical protein